mgnify:CR=1 FL=1
MFVIAELIAEEEFQSHNGAIAAFADNDLQH